MSTGAVNSVNFGENVQQQNEKHIAPYMAAGFISSFVPTYFFFKNPIKADKVLGLDKDTFEKTFKKVPEGKKGIVKAISEAVNCTNKDSIDEIVKTIIGDAETISAEDFLHKNNFETKELLEKALKDSAEETKKVTEDYNLAVEALNKSQPGAQENLNKVKSQFIDKLRTFEELSNKKAILDLAKEGKISKETIQKVASKSLKIEAEVMIKESLEELKEDVPRVKSWKKAGIYGLIGAGLFGIVAFVLGGDKKTKKPTK